MQLKPVESTPATSVYDGTIDIASDEARPSYTSYRESLVKFTFVNDRLGRTLEINYPVEVAIRQTVSVSPPQVTFLAGSTEQRRTIVVQSAQGLDLDAAQCDSPCLQAAIHRIDARALMISLVFQPAHANGALPESLACDLLSGGKTIGTVPINFIETR